MSVSEIVSANNKLLEQRFIKRIKKCTLFKINQTKKYDDAFNHLISKLNQQ